MKNRKGIGNYDKHRLYYAQATKMYFEDGLDYRRINKLIPIAVTTLKRWCDTFAEENGITMEKKVHKKSKQNLLVSGSTGLPNNITALQAELIKIQNELKHEKLRANAFNAMIDIAETKYNIPIRKKAGAKR